jgi:anti-sigma regulatory factor (Ser/Thr protein kinase)
MALRTQEGIARESDHIVHFYEREPELIDALVPLRQVSQLHSSVAHPWVEDRQDRTEGSKEFELAAEFGAGREDPGRARRMVVAALRRGGYGDTLVHDAALVLTELAANAVLHACSPFSISVSSKDSVLRIAVGDRGPLAGGPAGQGLIPRPGRGLGLIDAISARWGTAVLTGGKIVWAELEVSRHEERVQNRRRVLGVP